MADDIQLLIGKSGSKDVLIEAQEFVTGRTCVIGQSGSGKSYTIAVLCEKLLQNNIAFCIVDTEGEYFSLKEKFEVLWVGGQQADVNIESVDFADLIEKSIKNNVPLILDVSDVLEQRKVVADFASKLYEVESNVREPYLLVIEEADKFVPQSKDSLKELEEISKRGRKRGLGLLVATQRPSLVNKNILSQCGNQVIGKLTTENDLKAVDLFFEDRKELELLPKLNPGEFFVMGNLSKEKVKIKVSQRVTQHKGLTPKLVQKSTGKITELKTSLGFSERIEKEEKIEKREFGRGSVSGMEVVITKNQIDKIIEEKRKKKYGLFGEREHINSIDLVYQPLVWTEVNVLEGIIKKSYKPYSFILDGVSGEFVNIKNGLDYSEGVSKLVGLSENDVKVFLEIHRNKKITIGDLELKTKLSELTVRKIVSNLQDRKIVTFFKDGKSKLYSLLINFRAPDLKQSASLPETKSVSGKTNKVNLTEDSLRSVVKGLKENSDVTKFETFYYPIWFVSLGNRKLRIDGVGGKEI